MAQTELYLALGLTAVAAGIVVAATSQTHTPAVQQTVTSVNTTAP